MAKRRATRTSPPHPYDALFQMVVGKWISQAVGTVVGSVADGDLIRLAPRTGLLLRPDLGGS